ncbi:leucyl aminopeptidase [Siccirubricoccus sp. KC 17139]|uniref:Probable cytosol aminopeptidase n=1 Tax=Siccirubricoccus soli TaxID=2899147 RepID=A0ABT1D9J2_9PROT|nr:leucyl aminopeptidase [Siccirubricoccus soli]MCO6418599.1 leucyl aminopeptidase [Siccirubricoccus soli]MCP2684734.1 leucyl aminopeptidase [Siccirubricoccus soli]
MLDIAFVKPALPRHGALVLPLAEGAETALTGLAQAIDAATGGAVLKALAAAGFKGRKGQSATIWAPALEGGAPGPAKLVALGLGKEMTAEAAEAAGGALLPLISGEREAVIAAEALPAPIAASLSLGLLLRSYRFDRYRTTEKEEDKPKLERVSVATDAASAVKAAWAPMRAVADGVFLARDLVSEPPNVLNPSEFADRLQALESHGLVVEVLGPKEMRKLGFGALLGVAQGSAEEPRMVVMQWNGATGGKAKKAAQKPVAFIGKGVTFDTGGISIKPAAGMEDMKFDMAGAGAVAGVMLALAGRRAKVDAVGLVGLVENMPSGSAQRPGDVVKTASGQTVEVINTDAEGRLVLADVIHYCQQRFAPRFMVDLATLTGAIIISLGHEHAGLFSNDDALAQQLTAAGKTVGEALWRMPLGEAYDKQLKSDIADMKNVGGRPGGSITAAHFIQRFVDTKDGPMPWAHLDIAGTAWTTKDLPTVPKGATGFGVRLLDRLVAEHYEG